MKLTHMTSKETWCDDVNVKSMYTVQQIDK